MSVCFMFGREAGEKISDRECSICQRTVNDGRQGWCFECFKQWYDGDLSHANGDNLNPLKIANHVRAKHKLPPLTAEQVARRMAQP